MEIYCNIYYKKNSKITLPFKWASPKEISQNSSLFTPDLIPFIYKPKQYQYSTINPTISLTRA